MDERFDLPDGLVMAIQGGIRRLGAFNIQASSIEFPYCMKKIVGNIEEMFGIPAKTSWMRHHIRIGADGTRSVYIAVENEQKMKFGEPLMFHYADPRLIGMKAKIINDELEKLNREMEMWQREAYEVKKWYHKVKEGL